MVKCACEFEPKLQIDCVMEIVSAVRKGQLIEARAELLQHAGCIVGSLGAYLEQSPVLEATTANDLPESLEEAAAEVEASIDALQQQPKPMALGTSVSPALVALLMRMVELLIARYL